MIVWSGRGIFTLLLLIGLIVISALSLPKSLYFYGNTCALIIASAFSWFCGMNWNSAKGRIFIDQATGKQVKMLNRHTLFFIPMQYYGPILAIGAILLGFRTHWVFGSIVLAIMAGAAAFIFLQKKKLNQSETEPAKATFKPAKPIESEIKPSPAMESTLSMEEQVRIKAEKEDPSRFMPS